MQFASSIARCYSRMRILSHLPTLALLCLLVGSTGGCTHDFVARRVGLPPADAPTPDCPGSPDVRKDSTSPATRIVAACLRTLGQNSHTVQAPAGRAARRLATNRLIDLYAPALLQAPGHTLVVPAGEGRSLRLGLRRGAGPGGLDPARFEKLEPTDAYKVAGLQQADQTPGEGAPLVGTLHPVTPVTSPGSSPSKAVPGITWTVTAVPVLDPAVKDGTRHLTLELYDPHTTRRVADPQGFPQPLAGDDTTPQAVVFTHIFPQKRGLRGFFNGNGDFSSTGIYPAQPPSADKTPLIIVHGLISDPSDFHVLQRVLEHDPTVYKHYQVWVFYYPSSLPVVYSAMLLREDLAAFIRQLDPHGNHPALHRAVLVGHSMGGLLGRLAISDGGDVYFHHFFRQPVDQLHLTPDQRDLVHRSFYYRANPDVAQVVFIATPHRGSKLASGLLGTMGRLLVRVPLAVRTRIGQITASNRGALVTGAPLKPASSVNSLAPGDPVIAAINEMPMRKGVRLHSILGDRGRGGPPGKSSDGVVPYKSAHLPQAESELIVPAGHTGTLMRPETAAEVVRIIHQADAGWTD